MRMIKRFRDHLGKQYDVEGSVGTTTIRGTKARVWIRAYGRHGHLTLSRWIRFDLKTAREFYVAFGDAIQQAEREERLYLENLHSMRESVTLSFVEDDETREDVT